MPAIDKIDIESELPRPWVIDNVRACVVDAEGRRIFNFDSFDWMISHRREFLLFLIGTVNSFDELKNFYLRHLEVPINVEDLIKIGKVR